MSSAQNRAQKLESVLQGLVTGTPDLTGCALVSDDGLIISSVLPADADEDSIGGMASVLVSVGTRVAVELELDDVSQVMIKGTAAHTLLVKAGDGALLLVLMTKKAKLGLIFLDVKRAAAAISNLI